MIADTYQELPTTFERWRLTVITATCLAAACLTNSPLRAVLSGEVENLTSAQGRLVKLRGHVVDAATGVGIPNATVTLSPSASGPRQETTTDGGGRFVAEVASPGSYVVRVKHEDYPGSGVYGEMWPGGPARPFRVLPADQSPDITIRLWSPAQVSGAVKTQDGSALVGATVQLIPQSSIPVTRTPTVFTAESARDGTYHIRNVPPGKYILGTIQSYQTVCPRNGPSSTCALQAREHTLRPVTLPSGEVRTYQSVFYPDAPDAASGQMLWLHSGEIRAFLDLTVPTVTSRVQLSGTVQSPKGALADLLVRATRDGNAVLGSAITLGDVVGTTDHDGHFRLIVPSGDYTLRTEYRTTISTGPITIVGPQGPLVTGTVRSLPLSDSDPQLEASTPVAVGSTDASGVDLTLVQSPSLRGTFRLDTTSRRLEPEQLSSMAVAVRSTEGFITSARVGVDENGGFYFPSLPADTYWVTAEGVPPEWSVAFVEIMGRNTDGRPIDVRDGAVGGVVIHLTNRPASISGVVGDSTGRAQPNATVFVFSKAGTRPQHGTRVPPMLLTTLSTNVSEFGEFTVGPLPSGDYDVVALNDAWLDLDWREPEILLRLSALSTEIKVSAGGRAAITLQSHALR